MLILLLATLSANENLFLSTEQQHLVTSVLTIIQNQFTPGRSIYISLPSYEVPGDFIFVAEILIKLVSKGINWPTNILRSNEEPPRKYYYDSGHSYILFLECKVEIMDYLGKQLVQLKELTSWEPRAKFLFILNKCVTEQPANIISTLFDELWGFAGIHNVVLLTFHSFEHLIDEKNCIFAYTWHVFNKNGKCLKVNEVILINQWLMEDQGRFLNSNIIFQDKELKSFFGCPIRVITTSFEPLISLSTTELDENGITRFKLKGMEVGIFELITRKLNLNVLYNELYPPNMSLFDKIYEAYVEMLLGQADVIFGAQPISKRTSELSFEAFPYDFVEYMWFVPCPRQVSGIDKVAKIFTISVWLSMLLVMLLIVTLMKWISKKHEYNVYKSVASCLLTVYAVTLGISVSQLPRTFQTRFIFLLFVVYSYCISFIFQCFFTTYLVSPEIEGRITSIEDLLKSDIALGHNNDLSQIIVDLANKNLVKVFHKSRECPHETYACLLRLLERNDLAVLSSITEFKLSLVTSNRSLDTVPCVINEYFSNLMLTIHLRRGSPLADRFNYMSMAVLEYGISKKIVNDFFATLQLERGTTIDHLDEDSKSEIKYFPFSVTNLKLANYVICIGSMVGLFVLIGEIIYFNFNIEEICFKRNGQSVRRFAVQSEKTKIKLKRRVYRSNGFQHIHKK
ncbi:Ionotropic receptor 674 [Blattella germanica]|nr:Ionotropic receptor 674 [Blattella germanica]